MLHKTIVRNMNLVTLAIFSTFMLDRTPKFGSHHWWSRSRSWWRSLRFFTQKEKHKHSSPVRKCGKSGETDSKKDHMGRSRRLRAINGRLSVAIAARQNMHLRWYFDFDECPVERRLSYKTGTFEGRKPHCYDYHREDHTAKNQRVSKSNSDWFAFVNRPLLVELTTYLTIVNPAKVEKFLSSSPSTCSKSYPETDNEHFCWFCKQGYCSAKN